MEHTEVGLLQRTAGATTSEKGGSQSKSKKKKIRIHVSMGERSKEMLDQLAYKTSASNTEVFRNALRLYAALIEEAEKGNKLYVKDKDGNLTEYRIFV